ncbi:hypothetical protein [Dactylosporangium sp. NPDC048998]|uniref:hypothetical protein n=1 Tax=Dactylosporangium sp. NPDC048998 TaxID=3363976 RepID=UPI00371F64E4
MMRFDQLLHETIDEMADEMKAPSAALVSASIARGRRIRRGRRLTGAGGALLAVAAIVLPWAVISRPGGSPAPEVPAASGTARDPGSTGLAGGWVVTGTGTRVLDRATGEYVSTEGKRAVLPAPVGDRILLDATPEPIQVMGVRDTQPVTVNDTNLGGDYRWSPAGDRLVGRASQKEPFESGFAVVDARTGTVSKHWVDVSRYDCSQCTYSWSRDGREIVMAIADRSGGESAEKVSRLQLFDAATGAPTRSLPVKAMPSSPFSWSPSGRYVIANADELRRDWQLIDVSTGQSRPFAYDAVWVSDTQLLATDAGKVLTLSTDGTITATTEIDIPGAAEWISLGPPGQ